LLDDRCEDPQAATKRTRVKKQTRFIATTSAFFLMQDGYVKDVRYQLCGTASAAPAPGSLSAKLAHVTAHVCPLALPALRTLRRMVVGIRPGHAMQPF